MKRLIKGLFSLAFSLMVFIPVVNAATSINEIEVEVIPPTVGDVFKGEDAGGYIELTEPMVSVPDGAPYYVSWTMYIKDYPSSNPAYEYTEEFSDTFKAGQKYYLEVYLTPEDGYEFGDGLSYSIYGVDDYELSDFLSANQFAFFAEITPEEGAEPGDFYSYEVEDNDFDIAIAEKDSNLKNIIPVTDEEWDAVQAGEDLLVHITSEDIKKTIGDSNKRKIDRELYEGEVVGYYIDINLYKETTYGPIEEVEKTKKELELSFDLPKEMLNKDKNIKRTYYIFKLVDNKAYRIPVEEKDGKIWWNVKEFDKFALTYVDEEINATNTVTKKSVSNPNTLDNITVYMILLVLSVVSAGASILYFKKINN